MHISLCPKVLIAFLSKQNKLFLERLGEGSGGEGKGEHKERKGNTRGRGHAKKEGKGEAKCGQIENIL